jgi:signal peptidase
LAKRYEKAVIGLLAGLMILIVAMALVPFVGVRFDTVYSGSMNPGINQGDKVVAVPMVAEQLKVGDVVVFHSPYGSGLICHRIISIDASSRTFQTKGDANEDRDPYTVQADQLVGKVAFKIPLIGQPMLVLRGSVGLICIGGLFTLPMFWKEEPSCPQTGAWM